MNRRFRLPTDLSLRLLALLLAVALWFVAAEDRRTAPGETLEEQAIVVPVSVQGVSDGLIMVESPEPVSVRVRYPTEAVLTDIAATVDASGLTDGEHRIRVSVVVPPRVVVVGVEPNNVSLRLEKVIAKDFPVQVAVVGLPAASGVEVQIPEPKSVTVKGAASRVGSVDRVQATVLYKERSLTHVSRLQPVDASGREVESVEVAPAEATVILVEVPLGETQAEVSQAPQV